MAPSAPFVEVLLFKLGLIPLHLPGQFHLSQLHEQPDQVAKVLFVVDEGLGHFVVALSVDDVRSAWPTASVRPDPPPPFLHIVLRPADSLLLILLEVGGGLVPLPRLRPSRLRGRISILQSRRALGSIHSPAALLVVEVLTTTLVAVARRCRRPLALYRGTAAFCPTTASVSRSLSLAKLCSGLLRSFHVCPIRVFVESIRHLSLLIGRLARGITIRQPPARWSTL